MNTEELVSLKYNNFQEHISSSFGSLRSELDFNDVTLVSEDGQHVEAHRVVLASSSIFFRNLFKRIRHPQAFIYMRGMRSEDLVAMVDFMYLGEVSIHQDNVDNFICIAEELKLKGWQKGPEVIKQETVNESPCTKHISSLEPTTILQDSVQSTDVLDETSGENTVEGKEKLNLFVEQNTETIDAKIDLIKSMVTRDSDRRFSCNVCQKTTKYRANINTHVERSHTDGLNYPCPRCGKTFR